MFGPFKTVNPNEFHQKHYTHDKINDLIASIGGLRLIEWFGQNVYHMNDGRVQNVLPDAEMCLTRESQGQVLLYVLQGAT